MWIHVGERKDLHQTQRVQEVLSTLIEHISDLPSHSRSRNGNDNQADQFRAGADVGRMKAYLHRRLVTRQYRRSEVFSPDSVAPSSLLLIILDDVWDECIIDALSKLPAAFVVTSRDMNILQRVMTRVEKVRRNCM